MPDILRTPDCIHIDAEGGKDASVRFVSTADGITVYLQAESAHPKLIKLRWQEKTEGQVLVLGDAWERGYGNLQWAGICAERFMPWYFLASQRDALITTGYGVMVLPSAMASWSYDGDGISLFLDVRCGGVGVQLNGRELEVCTIVSRRYEGISAYEAAKDFCHIMSPHPLLPGSPIYGGNNWYYAYGKSSFDEIVSDAALQAKLAEGLENRPFMVVDDGWQKNGCAGPWVPNKRFGDMGKVAQSFLSMGVRPGIWVRFLRDERPELPPQWRLNRKNREVTDPAFLSEGFLDPSHPEVLQFIADDVKKMVFCWGFELIKHDFSTFDLFGDWGKDRNGLITDDGWSFYDKTKTSAEIVKQFYQTILEATGGKCLILGCNCIGHLLAGLAHANRTGDDTSGVSWQRTRQMGVNTLAFRLCQNGSFFAADADCVGIIPEQIDWNLNRQWAQLLACSASPFFLSCPDGGLTKPQFDFMKQMYARASKGADELAPLDWETNVTPCRYLLNGQEITFDWFSPYGGDLLP